MKDQQAKYVAVFHARPHLDELFALALFYIYGRRSTFRVQWREELAVDIHTPERHGHLKDGDTDSNGRICIFIGVGGGQFDEHGTGTAPAKAVSAAQLVADHLRCANEPGVAKLLQEVNKRDQGLVDSRPGLFDLDSLRLQLFEFEPSPESQVRTIIMLSRMLEKVIRNNRRRMDFGRELPTPEVRTFGGYTVNVVTVQHECQLSRCQQGYDVLLAQMAGTDRFAGHYQLRVNREKPELVMLASKMAEGIRIAEATKKFGGAVPTPVAAQAEHQGLVRGVAEWHFYAPTGLVSNGTPTHPHVVRSSLSLSEITQVVHGILKEYFGDEEPTDVGSKTFLR